MPMSKSVELCKFFNARLTFIFLLIGSISIQAVSQSFATINLTNVPQKTVRKYIESRSFNKMQNFSGIHSSWKNDFKESDFKLVEKIFFLKSNVSDVWIYFLNTNTYKMWNGNTIRFGLLLLKSTNSVVYADSDNFPAIDTGQIYFLDVRLLKGIVDIPLAFEVINIDPVMKVFELSYIENNKAIGKQTLKFIDNGNGTTRIDHLSYFRSESTFRDEFLYPRFHKRFIKKFHRNLRHLILEEIQADKVKS
jgi:hypothetical protein